jgi:KDO2-lipid IV(A) lauroyltransferase
MERPSRISDRFNHWALKHGFPALLKVAPRLSRRANHLGARLVIGAVMGLYRSPHAAVDRNLARILGEPADSLRVRAARWRMFHLFGRAWVDLFRFAQLDAASSAAQVSELAGQEHLDAARARGKGVILLTAHLGCWELGGVFLRQLNLPLSVVYVPDAFADVESARRTLRRASGVDEIPIQPQDSLASLPVLRALRENRVVAMQGDRDFNDRGEWFDFFGAAAPFPTGPFHLARMTGAALVPCFIAYSGDGKFTLDLEPMITVESTAHREADVRAAMQRWLPTLENALRRWPLQWFTFYDFWGKPAPAGPVADSVAAAGSRA